MQTLEQRFTDKSDWGDGPWQDEPDKVQWQDEATGLPCLIVRNAMGALCGYVGVSKSHPAHGVDSDALITRINVHGSLNFADTCLRGDEHGVGYKIDPDEDDDIWWLGFDCGHAFDLSPGMVARVRRLPGYPNDDHWQGVYRDLSYVREEVARLAAQLKAMA